MAVRRGAEAFSPDPRIGGAWFKRQRPRRQFESPTRMSFYPRSASTMVLRTIRRRFSGENGPAARADAACLLQAIPIAMGGRQHIAIFGVERTAANHAGRIRRFKVVRTPLPDVAAQVIDPEPVGGEA